MQTQQTCAHHKTLHSRVLAGVFDTPTRVANSPGRFPFIPIFAAQHGSSSTQYTFLIQLAAPLPLLCICSLAFQLAGPRSATWAQVSHLGPAMLLMLTATVSSIEQFIDPHTVCAHYTYMPHHCHTIHGNSCPQARSTWQLGASHEI